MKGQVKIVGHYMDTDGQFLQTDDQVGKPGILVHWQCKDNLINLIFAANRHGFVQATKQRKSYACWPLTIRRITQEANDLKFGPVLPFQLSNDLIANFADADNQYTCRTYAMIAL